jgi:hypothetical protein
MDGQTSLDRFQAHCGFFGRYAIRVKPETGKARGFEAVLRKKGENRWRFTETQ